MNATGGSTIELAVLQLTVTDPTGLNAGSLPLRFKHKPTVGQVDISYSGLDHGRAGLLRTLALRAGTLELDPFQNQRGIRRQGFAQPNHRVETRCSFDRQ